VGIITSKAEIRSDQELVIEFIDVADLAFFIKTKFRENDIGKGLVHGAFS